MNFKLLLLTIAFSAIAVVARANITPCTPGNGGNGEENKRIDIAGGVMHTDTKKPLVNVSVTAYSTSKKEKVVMTDGNGNYSFNELKPGTYKLVFEKNGFKKVIRDRVTIKSDEGCQLNVEMDDEDNFEIIPGQLFIDF